MNAAVRLCSSVIGDHNCEDRESSKLLVAAPENRDSSERRRYTVGILLEHGGDA